MWTGVCTQAVTDSRRESRNYSLFHVLIFEGFIHPFTRVIVLRTVASAVIPSCIQEVAQFFLQSSLQTLSTTLKTVSTKIVKVFTGAGIHLCICAASVN